MYDENKSGPVWWFDKYHEVATKLVNLIMKSYPKMAYRVVNDDQDRDKRWLSVIPIPDSTSHWWINEGDDSRHNQIEALDVVDDLAQLSHNDTQKHETATFAATSALSSQRSLEWEWLLPLLTQSHIQAWLGQQLEEVQSFTNKHSTTGIQGGTDVDIKAGNRQGMHMVLQGHTTIDTNKNFQCQCKLCSIL